MMANGYPFFKRNDDDDNNSNESDNDVRQKTHIGNYFSESSRFVAKIHISILNKSKNNEIKYKYRYR